MRLHRTPLTGCDFAALPAPGLDFSVDSYRRLLGLRVWGQVPSQTAGSCDRIPYLDQSYLTRQLVLEGRLSGKARTSPFAMS
jgi:hypothetical protein